MNERNDRWRLSDNGLYAVVWTGLFLLLAFVAGSVAYYQLSTIGRDEDPAATQREEALQLRHRECILAGGSMVHGECIQVRCAQ